MDVGEVVEVDEKGLAGLAGARAVVGIELDVGRPGDAPERIAEGLDHALLAVGELVEGGEVEVDGAGALGHEPLQEAAPSLRRRASRSSSG